MAIIDELRKDEEFRKANELNKADKEIQFVQCTSLINQIVSRLTLEARQGIRNKKKVSCKGTIYIYRSDIGGCYYSIGMPRNPADPDDWGSCIFYTEDAAQYVVEELKGMIEKEFRPQRLNVRYDSHKKGVFKVQKYYTVYVDVLINCK